MRVPYCNLTATSGSESLYVESTRVESYQETQVLQNHTIDSCLHWLHEFVFEVLSRARLYEIVRILDLRQIQPARRQVIETSTYHRQGPKTRTLVSRRCKRRQLSKTAPSRLICFKKACLSTHVHCKCCAVHFS